MSETVEKHPRDFLSKAEMAEFRTANDLKAFSMFVSNWLIIAACFALIAYTDEWWLILLALLVMAGRQLGIGILLHECSHYSFFSKQSWNRFFGHWFAGMPLLVPLAFYRPYHLVHHSRTGSDEDPDVLNIKQYPVSKGSFVRKLLRDFSGLSGLKVLSGVLLYVLPNRSGNTISMGKSAGEYSSDNKLLIAVKNYLHVVIFHSLLFGVFWLLDQPVLYLYWWLAYLFFYPFILRIRQIAEHGAMTALSSKDVRDTTRTTLASWWERLLFAPNYVNYHCEHHFLPTVPSYHLPRMHHVLRNRGFYRGHEGALVWQGYREVVRLASSAASS